MKKEKLADKLYIVLRLLSIVSVVLRRLALFR